MRFESQYDHECYMISSMTELLVTIPVSIIRL